MHPRPTPPKIEIQIAVYGGVDGGGSMDVKEKLSVILQGAPQEIAVTNATFGRDPAVNHVKQLHIQYTSAGRSEDKILRENESLLLRDPEAISTPHSYQLTTSADGKLQLLAWRGGEYAMTTSNGEIRQVQVAEVAPPVAIDGPWELRFLPTGRAPPSVSLDKLISWTDHSDSGVKYFRHGHLCEENPHPAGDAQSGSRDLPESRPREKSRAGET